MVNVIICDDNDKDRKNIFEVVKNFMDKNKEKRRIILLLLLLG